MQGGCDANNDNSWMADKNNDDDNVIVKNEDFFLNCFVVRSKKS